MQSAQLKRVFKDLTELDKKFLAFDCLDPTETILWADALNEFADNHYDWLKESEPGDDEQFMKAQVEQVTSALYHGNILRLMRYVKLMYPRGQWRCFEASEKIFSKLKF
jgi:hypothetical protein